MHRLQQHLRTTFLAGILAATPLAVTAFLIYLAEAKTRELMHVHVPFLGVIIVAAAIYLSGLIVTSLIGGWLLRILDSLLQRIPILRDLYRAWKQIAVTPGGSMGMFARVVLVPNAAGQLMIGFSSVNDAPAGADAANCCVFIPAAPNPTSGQLLLVPRSQIRVTDLSAEEGFKTILSGGNYLPEDLLAPMSAPAKL